MRRQIQKILQAGRITIPKWKNWKVGEYVLVKDMGNSIEIVKGKVIEA